MRAARARGRGGRGGAGRPRRPRPGSPTGLAPGAGSARGRGARGRAGGAGRRRGEGGGARPAPCTAAVFIGHRLTLPGGRFRAADPLPPGGCSPGAAEGAARPGRGARPGPAGQASTSAPSPLRRRPCRTPHDGGQRGMSQEPGAEVRCVRRAGNTPGAGWRPGHATATMRRGLGAAGEAQGSCAATPGGLQKWGPFPGRSRWASDSARPSRSPSPRLLA